MFGTKVLNLALWSNKEHRPVGDLIYCISLLSKLAIFPFSNPPCEGNHVCVWHCSNRNDESLERVSLLIQQRGMFPFGYKAFLRDLRRGCGQKLEWVDLYEDYWHSCLSLSLDRWLARQSHLWLQPCRGVWIQYCWVAKHAVSLSQQQGSGQWYTVIAFKGEQAFLWMQIDGLIKHQPTCFRFNFLKAIQLFFFLVSYLSGPQTMADK